MRVGIIGAGIAGLTTAKVLKSFGHRVTVFEKEADLGGVWSAARRYPGLTTQNVRSTYAMSDFPYPPDYPEWPSGEQVQRYLESYAREFGIHDCIRFSTAVVKAAFSPRDETWTLAFTAADGSTYKETFDYCIVCNGTFSTPAIPSFVGAEEFEAHGGRIAHTSHVHDVAEVKGKHVMVIGYGKSSCDVALALLGSAASVTVVARNLIWKVPKKLFNVLNYKYLLLTRLGEALFRYFRIRGVERFLHGPGRFMRNSMLSQIGWVVTRQCRLRELGLRPSTPFESIARSTVSLVTDGFYEAIASGRLYMRKSAQVDRLSGDVQGTHATLGSGEMLPVDVLICGTGWHQRIPFLDADVAARVTDRNGNFRLYRSIAPVGLPRLLFNGYAGSLFSQLNCEMSALWIADLIGGNLHLPSAQDQDKDIDERLAWTEERTGGKHAKNTNLTPFSLHHVDELLTDLRLPLSTLTRLKQWLLPVDPADFAVVERRLLERYASLGTSKAIGPRPPDSARL